jgi:1-aminocyclopropane-1-carboxylate deaminase
MNKTTSLFNQNYISKNQQIFLKELKEKNIQLFIKREDQIHPLVSGNKFRKLKYNLLEAQRQQKKTLLTFGGAFSNHILATAVAGKLQGFKTIGIIRGDELGKDTSKTLSTNSTLKQASENGMQFEFISREQYRDKTNPKFLKTLEEKYGNFYLIPEGGTNELAVKGCEEILTTEDGQFDYICSCVGTGGTISGIINSAANHQKVLGFPALKGDFLESEIEKFSVKSKNWELIKEYHYGGYGKYTDELIHFVNRFKKETQIPLDPIYTGKMLFGIVDMIQKNEFSNGSKILAVHTGGLQGIEGFNRRLQDKQKDLKIL